MITEITSVAWETGLWNQNINPHELPMLLQLTLQTKSHLCFTCVAAFSFSTSHSLRALLDGLQETNLFRYSFAGNSCSGNPNSCGKHEQLSSCWGNESLQKCSGELPAASLGVISFLSFLISLHHQPFSYHLISFIRCSLLWIPLNYKSL